MNRKISILFLVIISSFVVYKLINIGKVDNPKQTQLSEDVEVSTFSLEDARNLILNRLEVIEFISENDGEYVLMDSALENGGFQIEIHNKGGGVAPLWNMYKLDSNGKIVDMWLVYDDEGNYICDYAQMNCEENGFYGFEK